MVAVIQRVLEASVEVEGAIVGKIQEGLLVLLGIDETDTEADADWLTQKICNARIFSDDEGKMNLSVNDVQGNLLVISQFTLIADYAKGNRPSFIRAAKPEKAVPLYEHFLFRINQLAIKSIEKGIFGADMKVRLLNNGPVTLVFNSQTKK